MIQVQVGAAPWLPAPTAEPVVEYEYHDFPLSGVIRQHGTEYFFMCAAGQDEPVHLWIYWLALAGERRYLGSSSGTQEFRQRLQGFPLHSRTVLAVADDEHGIRGWYEFNPRRAGLPGSSGKG